MSAQRNVVKFQAHSTLMDKHYLTPLFNPRTVAVFSRTASSDSATQAQALSAYEWLSQQAFTGTVHHIDMHASSSLSDLAHACGPDR